MFEEGNFNIKKNPGYIYNQISLFYNMSSQVTLFWISVLLQNIFVISNLNELDIEFLVFIPIYS